MALNHFLNWTLESNGMIDYKIMLKIFEHTGSHFEHNQNSEINETRQNKGGQISGVI